MVRRAQLHSQCYSRRRPSTSRLDILRAITRVRGQLACRMTCLRPSQWPLAALGVSSLRPGTISDDRCTFPIFSKRLLVQVMLSNARATVA